MRLQLIYWLLLIPYNPIINWMNMGITFITQPSHSHCCWYVWIWNYILMLLLTTFPTVGRRRRGRQKCSLFIHSHSPSSEESQLKLENRTSANINQWKLNGIYDWLKASRLYVRVHQSEVWFVSCGVMSAHVCMWECREMFLLYVFLNAQIVLQLII